jgi:hypothetical protein
VKGDGRKAVALFSTAGRELAAAPTDHLVGLLRRAVGSGDGVDIRWQRR